MIKSTQNTNSLTPIVAVTAFPDLAAQIFDYMMVKPVTREEIEKRLQLFCPIQPNVSEVATPSKESVPQMGAGEFLAKSRSGSMSSSTTPMSTRPMLFERERGREREREKEKEKEKEREREKEKKAIRDRSIGCGVGVDVDVGADSGTEAVAGAVARTLAESESEEGASTPSTEGASSMNNEAAVEDEEEVLVENEEEEGNGTEVATA